MIVMKFGGSSLADARRIDQVAQLAGAAAQSSPCLVLSAVGDTTDRLLGIVAHTERGDAEQAGSELESLFAATNHIATDLLDDPTPAHRATESLQRDLALLVRGAARAANRSARVTDSVIAYGERISTELLTARLRERGHDAVRVDARDVIRTNATFGKAAPRRGEIRRLAMQNIAPALGRGSIVVTEGFVGSSDDGATTTLGRGGSDWSASLLGAGLKAEEVQIWTDVEGIHTADPRVAGDARPIAHLSADEAAELAAFGARVLHPSTIKPAVDAGVPVTVRHTMQPAGRFTRIEARDTPGNGIAAIASRAPVTVLTMTSRRMLAASGYLARLFEVFGELELPIDLVATAEVSVACTIEADAPVGRIVAALDGLAHVEARRDCAIVAAIGDGLQQTERVLERACRALHPIEPALVSFGGNTRNLSFVVGIEQQDDAVRRLHAEFFEESSTRDSQS